MKKFTHLLMMLCVFAGTAWAGPTDLPEITTDLENPIYYTISNTRSTSGKFVYWTENGIKDNTPVELTDAYKFYFTGDSYSNLKIHNAATSLLFSGTGAWTEGGVVCEIAVTPHSSNAGLAIKFSNTALNEKNSNDGYTTWSADDAGSIFVIESADLVVNPEGNKFYTIECPLFESVQGVKKGLYVDGDGNPGWNSVDLTDKAYYWTLIVNEGKYAFKNVKTGTYLNGTTMSETSVEGTINRLSSSQFNIVVNGTTVHANNHNSGNGAGSNIVSWGGSVNSASAWTFVEQADPDAATPVTIKYSFTYNGEVKYTQETNTIVGQEYPAITTTFPFGVSATKPEGTISDEGINGVKTVEIALSVNLPFVPATDNASIEHWYYIQMHSNPEHTKYIQYMDTYIEWADVNVDVADMDSYTWALVGNPFDGFKLVNKAAGTDKAVNSDGSGNPAIGEYASGVVWEIKNSATNNDNEHFCLKFPGGQYMNAQNGKIAFWGSADQGSTMWVTERDLTGATELQALIDQVKAAQENYVAGPTVGYLTQESVNAVAQAVTEAEAYLAGGSVTAEKSAEHQSAINDAIAALETVQPEEGKFYTIQNAYSNVYMGVDNTAGMASYTEAGFGQVFQFVSNGEGALCLCNVERGTYLSTAPTHGGGQSVASATTVAEAKTVTIANLGMENRVSITPQGGATLHHDANYSTVVGWNGDANSRSAWKIVEVADMSELSHSVTITEAEWATLVLGCNTTIPAGVKAYAVSAVGDGYATLADVTGTIPANEAVLLNAAAGTYEFKYAAESTPVENELVGTVFNTNVEANAYVLSAQGDPVVVGFYKAKFNVSTDTTNDGTTEEPAVTYEAFLNNAFKAYLPATTAESRFLVFNFGDDNATAIEGIEAENTADAVVYDLAGRRVQKAQKGLYIVNGKKVIK